MLPTGAMRRRIYRHLGWNDETGSASIQQCPTAHPGGVKCSRGGLSYFGLRCLVESRNQLSTVDTKATGATTFAPLVRLTPPLSKTQLATYADQGCLHCSNRWLCCARATRVCARDDLACYEWLEMHSSCSAEQSRCVPEADMECTICGLWDRVTIIKVIVTLIMALLFSS